VQRFGAAGFDYAGNSSTDLRVWQQARRAIVVSASAALVDQARACCELEKHIQPPVAGLATWLRMLRTHQWLKNVLLCVPLLGAHKLTDAALWMSLAMAFVAFGLCASAVYVTNDLLDLHSDRHHPHKRTRALAAGTVAIWQGVLLAPALLAAGLALAAQVTAAFLGWMLCYVVVTSAYSLWIKRLLLLDCLVLASLYMLRVVAGAAAVNFGLTFWLLAFSGFLFLSLAFVKRYAELSLHSQHGTAPSTRRAYRVSDAPLVQTLGVTCGVAAAVLLALYLNSDAVLRLYHTPALMWAAVPVLLFWISWMWMQAHRGAMHDDPLVFAVKDPASLWAGAAFAAALALGSLGWAG
jgi:4-hydroxybenzoate polyprenyltransferase